MDSFRFGKHPPRKDYRTLRLKKYTTKLAAPPQNCNVLAKVYAKLKTDSPATLFPMDANDKYGDCTIAALAHAVTVYHGLLGTKKILTTQQVESLYFHLTGGQDTGLDELNVLKYWSANPVAGTEVLTYVSIDPKDHTNVKQAIRLFGGVYLGFQVTDETIGQFKAKEPWTPGTLTNDGHAVYAVAYDKNEVTVLTWGSTQLGTWAWWDDCVDEAYAILPSQAKASDFDPGFDFAQLQADINALKHN